MTQPSVEEDWFSLDLESKLNKKIDSLQSLVHQQNELIQSLSAEIKHMKKELDSTHHRSPCEHLSSQNDRTHQLLEELKLIKERELNIMLREKIPVPFFSTKSSFPSQNIVTVPSLPSPLFLAQLQKNKVKPLHL
jgi:DNA gyrase/topoisomerase IV subunit A